MMRFKLKRGYQPQIPERVLQTYSERALDRVRAKLDGMTSDDDVPLPVARQVDRLIAQAVDTRNLAVMYVGWGSYL
jgi:phosphatidylinositol kinase/protein kinase (PI-3  family)